MSRYKITVETTVADVHVPGGQGDLSMREAAETAWAYMDTPSAWERVIVTDEDTGATVEYPVSAMPRRQLHQFGGWREPGKDEL